MAGRTDGKHPYDKLSPDPSVTDDSTEKKADEGVVPQEGISPLSRTRTVTQQVTVSEELTNAQGVGQITGQVTGQVTEKFYTSKEPTAPTATRNAPGPSGPPKVTVSQAAGTITEKLPATNEVKHVKIAGQVTEITASQGDSPATAEKAPGSKVAKQTIIAGQVTESSNPQELPQTINSPDDSGYQTPVLGIETSTRRSTRSIRKAIISAVLDGSPFKRSSSYNEAKPLHKNPREFDQVTPNPRSQTAADPPRPPMLGYEWVWYPAGYWAEREIMPRPTKTFRPPKWVRRSLQESVNTSSGSTPDASAPRSLNASEVWLKHPADLAEDAQYIPQRRRASTPPGRPGPDRETSTPKNLFRKLQQLSHNRNTSGSSANKGKEPEESQLESPPLDLERQTTNTLQETSNYFNQFLAMKSQKERGMHPQSPGEKSIKLRRKRFGLAPWHQNDSGDTVWSTPSSIRDLLFGKTPVPTPQPGAESTDSKSDQYFGVEVPGSQTVDQNLRDDNVAPSEDDGIDDSCRRLAFRRPPLPARDSDPSGLSLPNSRGSMTPLGSQTASERLRDGDDGEIVYRDMHRSSRRESFANELTEHLPNSPLCPMHPKHESLGRGFCPYHSLTS